MGERGLAEVGAMLPQPLQLPCQRITEQLTGGADVGDILRNAVLASRCTSLTRHYMPLCIPDVALTPIEHCVNLAECCIPMPERL